MEFGNSFFGMRIEEVRQTAGEMSRAAQNVNEVVSRLNQAIRETDWRGPDADAFRDEWSSTHAPALRRAASDVEVSAGQVRTSIEAQVRASEAN